VRAVLVDGGPLIALLDRGDAHHNECLKALQTIRDPLLTVWPAFTEAMYLLNFSWTAQRALWEMLETEALGLARLDHEDGPRMKSLMQKYRDLPMDLADAALVRVAEREKISQIFTLNRRDFRTYRAAGIGTLSIIRG
jgi:predicted nucleic acid-binding protein